MPAIVGLPAATALCRRSAPTLLNLSLRSAPRPAPSSIGRQLSTFARPTPVLREPMHRIPRGFPGRHNVKDSIAVAATRASSSSGANNARKSGVELAAIALALAGAATIAGVASDRGSFAPQPIRCDSGPLSSSNNPLSSSASSDIEDIPKSIVSVPSLTFGTLCGLCAGIFIKKGAKLIAFFLGAGYVLLQYLSSESLISVNWSAMSDRYDRFINKAARDSDKEGADTVRSITGNNGKIVKIWNNFVHFLTADFQQRATFLAGLALGLRLG